VLIIFRAIILVALGTSIFYKTWFNVFILVLTFILSFLPDFIERKLDVDYPNEFEFSILFFVFASLYLGEVKNFYYHIWWWDLMLHTLSGVIMGLFAFSLVYVLNDKKVLSMNPFFIVLFSFSFAVMIGSFWEIVEFTIDNLFGLNTQKSGLVDTMWDIIVNFIGAIFISSIGYIYIKSKGVFFRLNSSNK